MTRSFQSAMYSSAVAITRPQDLQNLPAADVVRLAQRGRDDAFGELAAGMPPIFSLICRMVRDRETSEDPAQDTSSRS
jgi:hypothetical protein